MSIEVKNMSHIYMPGTPFESAALVDVNLQLHEGEFVGLIGHTGSGKSTLVQHLNGLLKPTSGTLFVYDVELTKKDADMKFVRSRVGLVFQYPEHQLFEETVEADVAFGPKNMGLGGEELTACVKEAIQRVGLDYEAVRNRSPFELSGGQRRRVAIAGVIAMNPKFLILDEPTAGLDPQGRDELLELVQDLNKSGTGILMITHSMDDIARVADRILVIDKGRIVMDGTPGEVFSHVEELEAIGLDVPETSRLRMLLEKEGIELPSDIFTAEEAASYLCKLMGGGSHA
ncbi:MAG: energy-coupling factor transporter ATPase [Clostridia bacterium]|nr:energy-coupling factor transporter ATPase [Clostridia bacterium]